MIMTEQEKLLKKYYKGQTSLNEERELKSIFKKDEEPTAEQDIFGYFDFKSKIPDNLEENIFAKLRTRQKKGKTIRMQLVSIASVVAVILFIISIFIDFRNKRNSQLEDNFFVMEQALFQISESLQPPQEQEEMLVLWVDDDIEIIIN